MRFAFFLLLASIIGLFNTRSAHADCPVGDRPVVVGVPPADPFVIKESDGSYSGFDIELLSLIADRLDCDLEYVPVEFAGRIDALRESRVDAVVGGMTVTSKREASIDFSHTYFRAGQAILFHEDGMVEHQLKYVLALWKSTVALYFVGLIVFVMIWAHFIWAIEISIGRNNDKDNDPTNDVLFSRAYRIGIFQAVWFVNVTITTVGYGDYTPKTLLGRSLTAAMMWTGIAYGTVFLGAIVNFATSYSKEHDTAMTLDMLRGETAVVVAKTTGADAVMGYGINVVEVKTFQEAIGLYRKGIASAIVFDEPNLQYMVHNGGLTDSVVSPAFTEEYYGLGLATGSPLRDPVNVELLRLLESGEGHRLHTKYFGSGS